MTLGEHLKNMRSNQGLSQPEFAQVVGIEQSYLSKLENDKSVPSNDIFRQILAACKQDINQFLAEFDRTYLTSHLKQIPDVEAWLQRQLTSKANNQRRYLYVCSMLIIIAVTFFYVGVSKVLISETQYQYYSPGIVLHGEPKNIFRDWSKIVGHGKNFFQAQQEKKIEMAKRQDEVYALSPVYIGETYTQPHEKGLRSFRYIEDKQVANPINAWLQILGVLLFASGIMGFILERRFYK